MKNYKIYMLIIFLFSLTTIYTNKFLIVAEEYPPYVYVEDETAKGIDIDIVTLIFSRMGIETEFLIAPWLRSWNMVKEGAADACLTISFNEKRTEYVYYPQTEVWKAEFVAFTNNTVRKKYNIKNLYDIKNNNLKIGIINGNSYFPDFWKVFPTEDEATQKYYKNIEQANTAEQNFKKLATGRIDIFLLPKTVGLNLQQLMHLENLITFFPDIIFSKNYYTGFSKRSNFSSPDFLNIQAVLKQYNSELNKMIKSGELEKIINSYTE